MTASTLPSGRGILEPLKARESTQGANSPGQQAKIQRSSHSMRPEIRFAILGPCDFTTWPFDAPEQFPLWKAMLSFCSPSLRAILPNEPWINASDR
jgi:hypothetical protein